MIIPEAWTMAASLRSGSFPSTRMTNKEMSEQKKTE